MSRSITVVMACIACVFMLSACAEKKVMNTVSYESSVPGTQVSKKGQEIKLAGTAIKVGEPLPFTSLVDADSMESINLAAMRGQVLLLSIVPSIDTKVCEVQTHYLGEEGDVLPSTIQRITISRDTPFAQARFAGEADLEDLTYLSDYKEGAFGRSTGLLMDGPRLLARSVVVVDKQGIVRYIQVVPDITHLPDMEQAFARAKELDSLP